MLRSGIRSEILDLPVPSRHGKEERNKKEIIPLELVQYHQYSKCISARLPGAFISRLACKRSAIGGN